jgi:hypothetical protein
MTFRKFALISLLFVIFFVILSLNLNSFPLSVVFAVFDSLSTTFDSSLGKASNSKIYLYNCICVNYQMIDNVSHDQKNKAIRLTFSYEGDNITLVSRQKVDKFLPSSALSVNPPVSSKSWFELSDPQRNLIHTRSLDNLIKKDMEVFSEDPNNSIHRQKIPDIKGTFSILIPDIPNATNFDIFTLPVTTDSALMAENKKNVFHLNIKEGQDNQ